MTQIPEKKLVFIGAGHMAQAMIAGLLKTEHPPLGITSRTLSRCEPLKSQGVAVFADNRTAADWGDMVVLAVKPQNYAEVLADLRDVPHLEEKVLVTVAAGISTETVREKLGREVPVVRAMPNTPMQLGQGCTALSRGKDVTDAQFAAAERIFSASGTTFTLPESRMNAVIALTGSSPAYVYLLIRAMLDAAEAQGLSGDLLPAVCQTLRGAADLAEASEDSLDTLIEKVCSPGGTTERAVEVFRRRDFSGIVAEAMQACTDRAEELSASH